ncbi:MAG TPA: ATP-binding protein [Gemmatimonadaceae bacterium]
MPDSSRLARPRSRAAGIAGLRRYSNLFALALVVFGIMEVGLFGVQWWSAKWADYSRNVARIARAARAEVFDRNALIASYLLSSGAEGLEPARSVGVALEAHLDSLVEATGDNPRESLRARAIGNAVHAWNEQYANPVLAGTLAGPHASSLNQELLEPVRTTLAEFLTAEDVLYDDRRGRARMIGLVALAAMLVPSGLLAWLVVASGRRFAGQADQLADQQTQLEEQAMELEQQVQELEIANSGLAESVRAEKLARDDAEHEADARQRNAALLDAALASSPIGLSLLDSDLRYIRANQAIAAITGLPLEAHIGRTLRDVNPSLSPDIEAALRRVIETQEPIRNMEMMRAGTAPGSKMRQLLLNVYPIKLADGRPFGLGVAALDITDQRDLQAQFHHAQKLEAVGRLAAGIAHDFNNLLTVIRSYCDLALLEMADDAPGREEIKEIRTAGDRAAALARQMVAMSHKQAILPRALVVGEAISEMESMLRRVTGESVALTVRLHRPLGITQIDPTHLEQVMMNLVINAVDAMPNGGRITIEASNVVLDEKTAKAFVELVPGDYVAIAVSDTGTGIDEETLTRIFDPFFTTKSAGKGTGLGLSTVYGIVREAHGQVHVATVVGEGTTFTVYLPAERQADAKGLRTTPRPVLASAIATGEETLLVVEDEDLLRTSLVRVLKQRGYRVLEAAHGGEALRMSLDYQGAIDLVLSDFHMPGMHGRDLIARLRPHRPAMKVLFMSGSSVAAQDEPAPASVPDAFIAKPFSTDDLAAKVRALLDG